MIKTNNENKKSKIRVNWIILLKIHLQWIELLQLRLEYPDHSYVNKSVKR
jgi:hypothetical protein